MKVHKGKHPECPWTQWTLHGNWTTEEITAVETFLKEHMTPRSGYPWIVYKNKGFSARRNIWEGNFMLKGQTLQELMDRIRHYYETYEGI